MRCNHYNSEIATLKSTMFTSGRAVCARMIAGLCALSVCFAAQATLAAELSRGRQILLDRGLQIQSLVFAVNRPGFSDIDRWRSANFSTINLWDNPNPSLLSQLPAGTPWGRMYSYGAPETRYLSTAEAPYNDSFVSLQYSDEPRDLADAARLGDMAAAYRDWNSRYPDALAYSNFMVNYPPDAAALASYMSVTRPDMLSFDMYPWFYITHERSAPHQWSWYTMMQMYRTAALAGNDGTGAKPIPYAQFLDLTRTSYSGPYGVMPSESFVRLQQNASWAFGYTMVSAFIYNDPDPKSTMGSVMFSGPGDTSPTPVFNYVKEANRQSRNLGPALVRLLSTDIRMLPGTFNGAKLPLPKGVAAWAAGAQNTGGYADYITGIAQRGRDNILHPSAYSDVLVGYFKPLLADKSNCTFVDGLHFMIVNGAWGTPFGPGQAGDPASNSAEWFRIRFDFGTSGFDSLVRLRRDTGLVELVPLQHLSGGDGALYRLDLQLDGGTGDLFAFWNSSKPLPTILAPGAQVLRGAGAIGILVPAVRKKEDARGRRTSIRHRWLRHHQQPRFNGWLKIRTRGGS